MNLIANRLDNYGSENENGGMVEGEPGNRVQNHIGYDGLFERARRAAIPRKLSYQILGRENPDQRLAV